MFGTTIYSGYFAGFAYGDHAVVGDYSLQGPGAYGCAYHASKSEAGPGFCSVGAGFGGDAYSFDYHGISNGGRCVFRYLTSFEGFVGGPH